MRVKRLRHPLVNFAVPGLDTDGTVWSGLRLDDRRLVRAFTFAAATVSVEVEAFPGQKATLEARPDGATYLLLKGGKTERLDNSGRLQEASRKGAEDAK